MTQALLLEDLKTKLYPSALELLHSVASHQTTDVPPPVRERLRRKLERIASAQFRAEWEAVDSVIQRQQALEELLDEVIGFDPVAGYLRDPLVTEIMVNGPSAIFIERQGKVERSPRAFRDHDHLLSLIDKLLSRVGRQVTQSQPYLDARLPDGSRLNVAIAPVAIGGPYITIRRFVHQLLTMPHLIQQGTLSAQASRFLELCVAGRLNLVISGSASSGKTTLLNILLHTVDLGQRIVVIEDSVELQVDHPNVMRLATRQTNLEGKGEITIRHLLKNALHTRPDRIIVGEVRGEEALDMLQAMNTGHSGSMTTLHANNPAGAIERIVTMSLMSELELSDIAVKRQVVSAIDLVVHMERTADGGRHVVSISEMQRGDGSDEPRPVEVFTRIRDGRSADAAAAVLQPTGLIPHCVERLAERGLSVPRELFVRS